MLTYLYFIDHFTYCRDRGEGPSHYNIFDSYEVPSGTALHEKRGRKGEGEGRERGGRGEGEGRERGGRGEGEGREKGGRGELVWRKGIIDSEKKRHTLS